MSLKDDINTYFNDTFTNLGVSDSDLNAWMQQGYRDLIGKLPGQYLNRIVKNAGSLTEQAGHPLEGDELAYVVRDGYKCRQVSPAQADMLSNPSSIHYASSIDPACYVKNSTVFVIPTPSSDEPASIFYISIPSIDISTSQIDNLPDTLTQFPVMYSAIEGKKYLIREKLAEIDNLYDGDTQLDYTTYDNEHASEDIELANQTLSRLKLEDQEGAGKISNKINEIKTYQADVNSLTKQYDKELKEFIGIQPSKE